MSDINEISAALAKAQGEFPAIPKNKRVRIPGRGEYNYADLSQILDLTRPALNKHGISISQTIDETIEGKPACVSKAIHSSGQMITASCPILLDNKNMQSVGGAITYARRYSLSMLLCISADDDFDETSPDARIETKPARQATKQTQAEDSSSRPQSAVKPVKTREIKNVATGEARSVSDVGSYYVKFGKKYYGKTLEQMGYEEVKGYLAWIKKETEGSGKPMSPEGVDFVEHAEAFLKSYEPKEDLQIPF